MICPFIKQDKPFCRASMLYTPSMEPIKCLPWGDVTKTDLSRSTRILNIFIVFLLYGQNSFAYGGRGRGRGATFWNLLPNDCKSANTFPSFNAPFTLLRFCTKTEKKISVFVKPFTLPRTKTEVFKNALENGYLQNGGF